MVPCSVAWGALQCLKRQSLWRCTGCLQLYHCDAKRAVAARARPRGQPGPPPDDVVEQRQHCGSCRHAQLRSTVVLS